MFAASKTDSASTGGYQISRSLRFNVPDSTNLNRTFASAGNRQTWTYSAWVKRSGLSTSDEGTIFSAGATDGAVIRFETANILRLYDYSGGFSFNLITTQVFRDASAWYHIVLAYDSTQATSSDRTKLYVNGSQVTSFSTATYPSLNQNTYNFNNNVSHRIGNHAWDFIKFYSGYMTEVNFIDGQALTPSSFGYTNPATGVWSPLAFVGTYGTNGFYLNFSDNSNTTAATLGKDYSGNGNNWTPNNFSVTAGAGNDSLVDSPTSYGTDTGVGGEVRGNYCTMNPLDIGFNISLSNGNLDYSGGTADNTARATMGVSSGKWYWEFTPTTASPYLVIGVVDVSSSSNGIYVGQPSTSYGYYSFNGNKVNNATLTSYGATFGNNDVIGVALDMDAGTIAFYKNGTSQGTAFTGLTGTKIPAISNGVSSTMTAVFNFGQRPFAYTAPSGFKALCTQNLPTPTIGATTATQAGKFFNTVTFTSPNGGAVVTGVGFQPDFTWEKGRSVAESNALFNVLQGNSAYLISNSTAAEGSFTNIWVPSSDGFTIPPGVLSSGQTYVSWNWKANGSGSSNTSGSITSTVSANTTSGFSVVTYTGTGANATVGHGLGVAPSMVICKTRTGSSVGAWQTYHSALGATKTLFLNLTDAAYTNSLYWNNTAPTSSVFSLGGNTDGNGSGYTMVAYCFAEVAGYSKFGSFVGNGSSDGVFVYTGFRPAFVLIKQSSGGGGHWSLKDSARSPSNVALANLFPNLSNAETSEYDYDILSNGFKLRTTSITVNASGETYIYACFAQNPFKTSLAR